MQRENDGNLYRTDFRRNNPTAIYQPMAIYQIHVKIDVLPADVLNPVAVTLPFVGALPKFSASLPL